MYTMQVLKKYYLLLNKFYLKKVIPASVTDRFVKRSLKDRNKNTKT